MITSKYELAQALKNNGTLRYEHATGKADLNGIPVRASAVNALLHGPYSDSRIKMTYCGNDYNEYRLSV